MRIKAKPVGISQQDAAGGPQGDAMASASLLSAGLLTLEEVAELLRVPKSWVYERNRRGSADRIPGFRLGKYWRFRLGDVLVWLEQRQRK